MVVHMHFGIVIEKKRFKWFPMNFSVYLLEILAVIVVVAVGIDQRCSLFVIIIAVLVSFSFS